MGLGNCHDTASEFRERFGSICVSKFKVMCVILYGVQPRGFDVLWYLVKITPREWDPNTNGG